MSSPTSRIVPPLVGFLVYVDTHCRGIFRIMYTRHEWMLRLPGGSSSTSLEHWRLERWRLELRDGTGAPPQSLLRNQAIRNHRTDKLNFIPGPQHSDSKNNPLWNQRPLWGDWRSSQRLGGRDLGAVAQSSPQSPINKFIVGVDGRPRNKCTIPISDNKGLVVQVGMRGIHFDHFPPFAYLRWGNSLSRILVDLN